MNHEEDNSPWGQKGATLSDKTAQKEFNLDLAEILEAIKSGYPQRGQGIRLCFSRTHS